MQRKFSLSDISKIIWKNIVVIIVTTLLLSIFGGLYAKYKKHTTYDSERNIIISHSYQGSAANEEVQADINLGKTYAKIIESKDVAREARKKLPPKLRHAYSVDRIIGMIDAHPIFQTTIVKVKATAKTAKASSEIVNAVSVAGAKQIKKSVPSTGEVKLFAKASTDDAQSVTSPSIKKYAMMGAAVGFLLGMIIAFSVTTWTTLV